MQQRLRRRVVHLNCMHAVTDWHQCNVAASTVVYCNASALFVASQLAGIAIGAGFCATLDGGQLQLDVGSNGGRKSSRGIPIHNLAINYQKLGEVPGYALHRLSTPILRFKPLEQWVSTIPVNVDFCHNREVGAHAGCEFLNLVVRIELLAHKLIAWEPDDTETTWAFPKLVL